MNMLLRSNYPEIDEYYGERNLDVSDKCMDFIKDLVEDNTEIIISYKGVKISNENGILSFEDIVDENFSIYTPLEESDLDNFKIHGFTYDIVDGLCVIDSPSGSDARESEFITTNLFNLYGGKEESWNS